MEETKVAGASFLAEVKSLSIKTTASQDKVGQLKLEFNAQGNEALVDSVNRLYKSDDLVNIVIEPRGQA